MLEKIDWNVLDTYIEKDLIIANKHPDYDIWILNYSKTTQFTKAWDLYTVSCRGLVVDADGNILARPFQKFLNYEEHNPSDINMNDEFEIFEKMDGSLMIVFWYDVAGKWIVASRGSFNSEQSIEGEKMLTNKNLTYLDAGCTYIFEFIAPWNRIVVDYGNRWELVLLTIINTKTGHEYNYESLLGYLEEFSVVKKYEIPDVKNLLDLKQLEEDNREGFVIRFKKGFIVNGLLVTRLKVKFTEYCRLHDILTNISNVIIWRHLMDGLLIEDVPDEFYAWVKSTIKSLTQNYNEIERLVLKEFVDLYHVKGLVGRKEFAMEALKSKYSGILFNIYSNKNYSQIIWKLCRPQYSRPFKDGYETADIE